MRQWYNDGTPDFTILYAEESDGELCEKVCSEGSRLTTFVLNRLYKIKEFKTFNLIIYFKEEPYKSLDKLAKVRDTDRSYQEGDFVPHTPNDLQLSYISL